MTMAARKKHKQAPSASAPKEASTSSPPSNSSFLKLFWTLAETDNDKRCAAVEQILNHLVANEHDLQYTVKRLVRGLASSRDAARQGFSTALATVLEKYSEELPTADVLSQLQNAMQVQSSMKAMEQREHKFGLLFGLLAILKSGRLDNDSESAKAVVDEMLRLGQWKKWMTEAAYESILQVLEVVSPADFVEQGLWESIQTQLNAQGAEASVEQLQLAVGIQHYADSHSVELEGMSVVVSEDTLDDVKQVLLASSSVYPRVHSVWHGIFGHILQQEDSNLFVQAWKKLVDESLLSDETTTHERRALAFKLFTLVVGQVDADVVEKLMTEKLVKSLYNNVIGKRNYLHGAAKQCLRSFAVANPSAFATFFTRQFVTPSSYLLKTEAEEEETPEGTGFDAILRHEEERERKEASMKRLQSVRQWAIDALVSTLLQDVLLKSKEQEEAVVKDVLVFLFTHAYFVSKVSKKKKKKSVKPSPEVTEASRSLCATRLQTLLSHNLQTLESSMLHQAFSVATQLMSDASVELRSELEDDSEKAMETASKKAEETLSKASKDLMPAFSALFMVSYIRLLDEDQRQESVEAVGDLDQCLRRLTKKKKKTDDSVVVLCDLLLSLLSQGSSALRDIVTFAFKSLVPLLNESSLETMMQVLQPSEESEEKEEEEDDEEEEDEEEEVTLSSSSDVAAILGDESTSEMQKDDMALAAIVEQATEKSRRKVEEKKQKTQVQHFQLRVLDLLQVFVTKRGNDELVLSLLQPLWTRFTEIKSKDELVLKERLQSVLVSKIGGSKEPPVLSEKKEQGKELLQTLLDSLRASKDVQSSKVGKSLVLYLVRVLVKSGEDVEELEKMLRPAVLDTFTKKHSYFPRDLFEDLTNRFPTIGLPLLLPVLTEVASSTSEEGEVKPPVDSYLGSEVYRLLSLLLKPKLLEDADMKKVYTAQEKQLCDSLVVGLDKADKMKSKHFKSVVTCCSRFAVVCQSNKEKKKLQRKVPEVSSVSPAVKQQLSGVTKALTGGSKDKDKKRKRQE